MALWKKRKDRSSFLFSPSKRIGAASFIYLPLFYSKLPLATCCLRTIELSHQISTEREIKDGGQPE